MRRLASLSFDSPVANALQRKLLVRAGNRLASSFPPLIRCGKPGCPTATAHCGLDGGDHATFEQILQEVTESQKLANGKRSQNADIRPIYSAPYGPPRWGSPSRVFLLHKPGTWNMQMSAEHVGRRGWSREVQTRPSRLEETGLALAVSIALAALLLAAAAQQSAPAQGCIAFYDYSVSCLPAGPSFGSTTRGREGNHLMTGERILKLASAARQRAAPALHALGHRCLCLHARQASELGLVGILCMALVGGVLVAVDHTASAQSDADATRSGARDLGDVTQLGEMGPVGDGQWRDRLNGRDDEVDYYTFSLSETKLVGIGLRAMRRDADLFIENSSGDTLSWSRNSANTDEWLNAALPAGSYFVRVEARESGRNNYKMVMGTAAG